jgi:hypothetical protein
VDSLDDIDCLWAQFGLHPRGGYVGMLVPPCLCFLIAVYNFHIKIKGIVMSGECLMRTLIAINESSSSKSASSSREIGNLYPLKGCHLGPRRRRGYNIRPYNILYTTVHQNMARQD